MILSYKVNGQFLIKSALLPIDASKVYLITGNENRSYGLIGGIIAKLFPINEKLEWPQLQSLIEDYTGELTIEEGELPQSTAFVGVDPDHFLFFSKVKEEMIVQTNSSNNAAILRFGLDASFLERRISNLSGGEKMKVSLSVAFALKHSCYIFHGVIPWLDKSGREQFIKEILRVKNEGACIILLEHEAYPIRNIVDKVFNFNGTTTTEIDKVQYFSHSFINIDVQKNSQSLSKQIINSKLIQSHIASDSPVFEFEKVSFYNYPSSELLRKSPLLNEISFKLYNHRIYGLIGVNGAGKSTISQIAFRVLKPDSGNVKFCGESIQSIPRKKLIRQICYIGQFPEQQITLNTIKDYKLKTEIYGNILSKMLIEKWLDVSDDFPVSLLSVFQMKTLLLASSITSETKLIILDEMSWGVDEKGQATILNMLNDISKQLNFALFIISHNLNLVQALNAEIFFLNDGQLSIYKDMKELFSNTKNSSIFDIPRTLINNETNE